MAELAMDGGLHNRYYPTVNAETAAYVLEHSEAKFIFIGKLDVWDGKAGRADDMPSCFPLRRQTINRDDVIGQTEPSRPPGPDGGRYSHHHLHIWLTGRPKGVAWIWRDVRCDSGYAARVGDLASDKVCLIYLLTSSSVRTSNVCRSLPGHMCFLQRRSIHL